MTIDELNRSFVLFETYLAQKFGPVLPGAYGGTVVNDVQTGLVIIHDALAARVF
jgi:hypothetical protein